MGKAQREKNHIISKRRINIRSKIKWNINVKPNTAGFTLSLFNFLDTWKYQNITISCVKHLVFLHFVIAFIAYIYLKFSVINWDRNQCKIDGTISCNRLSCRIQSTQQHRHHSCYHKVFHLSCSGVS